MQKTSIGIVLTSLLAATVAFAQWEPDQRLTNDPASSKTAENSNTWAVAARGDTVHVVWADERHSTAYDEIYYKRSTDGGVTWGSDVRLTNNTGRSWCPSVAVAGDNVHVVWEDSRSGDWYDIYYRRSTDGGTTWVPEVLFPLAPRLGFEPSVAVAGDSVHVVWDGLPNETGRPLEVYYRRSTDGGATWGGVTRLTNDSSDYAWQPSVAAAGANVHVAWYDGRHGPTSPAEIYYKRSTDGGSTWESDMRLTNSIPNSQWTSIAAAGGSVHVVWSDVRDGGANEIYYKRSTDNGATWPTSPGGDTRLTPADGKTSYFPSVATADTNVHVVWCDRRDSISGDEVYYKRSSDGGTTWGSDIRLTVNDDMQSRHPSVAVAGAALHVVWYDNRDGDYEIYYKRNPTGNVAVSEPGLRGPCCILSVSPNPLTTGFATLRFSLSSPGPVSVAVFDVAGRAVIRQSAIYNLQPVMPLDLRKVPAGVYLVRLDADGYTTTQKLVVQR
jgi:Neuraminidase (sialidase)